MIYNLQTEQNILGEIFQLNGYGETADEVISSLTLDDFYAQDHKVIFAEIKRLNQQGIAASFDTVAISDSIDPLYRYTAELYKNTASAINIRHHAKALKSLTELRNIQNRVNEVNSIIAENGDIDEKLKNIEALFSAEIGATSNEQGAKHISECAESYLDYLDKRWNSPDEVIFTTGIPELDLIFGGGLEVGLHAIAARPKMGKTELMGKLINHFAVDRGLPIYVGSLEMPEDQVMHRLTSSLSRVNKDEIKNNFYTNGVQDEVAFGVFRKALGDLANTNTYIDTRHTNTVKKIRRECLKIQKKHGKVGGIFVDYLGLLESDSEHQNMNLTIAAMTRALKGMSKEFNCPVIMLLQLNRGLESRSDKRPVPSDSRDSGAIEQDVDSWTAIYRDSVYNKESPWKMITEIIVRLNRHGGTGTCYQNLTGHGFFNADEHEVARLVHMEETKEANSASKTSDF